MLPRRRVRRGRLLAPAVAAAVAVGLLASGTWTMLEHPGARESRAAQAPGAGAEPAGAPLDEVTEAPPERDLDATRPNVVVVMADDMRVDDLLFAPQIRRLVARRGLTFANSFSPYPLCCPARASFLTGQYAHNHRVYWHEAPYGYGSFDDSRTLATSMSEAGYRTGFIGKYLNLYGVQPSRVSGEPSHTYVPHGWDDWRGAVENPGDAGFSGGTYHYLNTPFNINGRVDDSHGGEYQSDVIGDFSVAMARRFAAGRKPFFMYVNYVAPHFGAPVEPGDIDRVLDDHGRLQDVRTPARPAWVRGRFDRLVDRGAGMPRDGGPSEADISDKPKAMRADPEPNAAERHGLRELTRQRAESIFVMDRQVARLVRTLKRTGEWENTVLAFTSDNGYFLGEHRRRSGKVRAHEPSLRVPLVMTGPGMRSGETRHDPVTTIDLSASILDLGGARPPVPADGDSRVPTMLGGDRGWDRPVLTEATHIGRGRSPGFSGPRSSIGVRTARYSLIRSRTGEHELYDLLTDPLQQRNVVRDPAYAVVLRDLEKVWWDLRNCRAAGCRPQLPESLAASAEEEARISEHYWREVGRVYGFGSGAPGQTP
ncbi:sulfatase family protein [Nocardioides pantholopis]|uniref:sulfatase family protein n=1 Tax=Nocardioides pantholopis TaxID=2483798 RepID=UPI000FDB06F8|nr:sulfatase [Nocardioides pantholopis]